MFGECAVNAVDEFATPPAGETLPVTNQVVIKGNIQHNTRIPALSGRKRAPEFSQQWVPVGEGINPPMLLHSLSDPRHQVQRLQRALEEVSRHIADKMLGIGAGKEGMGEMVHGRAQL